MEKTEQTKLAPQEAAMRDPVTIEVKNLIVDALPRIQLALGDIGSLAALVDQARDTVKGVVWNETRITLMTDNPAKEISYEPELHPAAEMFFQRENKRERAGLMEVGPRVWEGDYEPVHFQKKDLLKFLRSRDAIFPTEVEEALKNLKIRETKATDEIMLSLEEESTRTVEEEAKVTNLPKNFTVEMPVAEGYSASFILEAAVVQLKDEYNRAVKGRVIELRCTNTRQIKRDLMKHMMDQLPPEIPRYYGAMRVVKEGRSDER